MVYITNIEKDTIQNEFYRKVVNTANNMQLVLMSLNPNEEIGMEVHNNIDQFFRIEKGNGKLIIKNNNNITEHQISDGTVIIIPKGTYHNIINTGNDKLKLYTIYSPPNHPVNRVQEIKPKEDLDGGYYSKYLKYKTKYLKLKNN